MQAVKSLLHNRMRKKIARQLEILKEAKRYEDQRPIVYKELIGGTLLNREERELKVKTVYKYK